MRIEITGIYEDMLLTKASKINMNPTQYIQLLIEKVEIAMPEKILVHIETKTKLIQKKDNKGTPPQN